MAKRERSTRKERPVKGAPTAKDFQGDVRPDWCPGCGDYGGPEFPYKVLMPNSAKGIMNTSP